MNRSFRRKLENLLIILIAAASLALLILSFLPSLQVSGRIQIFLEMGKMVQRVFSIVLFVLSFQLMRRKQVAWWIAVFLFILNFLRSLAGLPHLYAVVLMDVDLLVLAMLVWFRKDFCCPTSRTSKKKSIFFLLLALSGIVANAGISYHYLRLGTEGSGVSFWESLSYGAGMIFGIKTPLLLGHGAQRVENFVFWFSWACILAALFHAARPWIDTRLHGKSDLHHARTLLNLYGQNPCSYLALEADKQLYFGNHTDGVVPYGTVGSTIIVNGDPICADNDFPSLLAEFREFCQKSAHDLFILNVTDHYLDEYQRQGFGYVKCGEEARFDLSEYEISGKKGAKMRMNINHATKAGVTVHEYCVSKQRNPELEKEFDRITEEWLREKKSSLLQFTLGGVGLDTPMDKRYFYGTNAEGQMVGFIVFVPFLGKKGYMADVTRHGANAPSGVMETIIYQAFQQFKEEGVQYGSLGVAPLAGLEQNTPNLVEKLLRFVYNNLNGCYGFRDLYRAKAKYSPTQWLPSYYAYLPKIPTPKMFYAIIKIQNPKGILDYVKGFLKGKRNGRK